MKALGLVGVVVAGLTIYWVVKAKSDYLKFLPPSPLPSSPNSPPASSAPIPGTQGGTAATGPAPGSSLFNQLFPQTGAINAGT